jgi:hypothetical protein
MLLFFFAGAVLVRLDLPSHASDHRVHDLARSKTAVVTMKRAIKLNGNLSFANDLT